MASTSEILYAMREDLAVWMTQRGYGDAVYIVEARIDEIVGQYAIQIIPGQDTAAHANSGVGLIRSQLEIAIWWRGHMDSMGRGTERIAGNTGVQLFADTLREYLVQRTYDGMLIALVLRQGGNVEAVSDMDGWLVLRDTYEFGYEMTWEVKV